MRTLERRVIQLESKKDDKATCIPVVILDSGETREEGLKRIGAEGRQDAISITFVEMQP